MRIEGEIGWKQLEGGCQQLQHLNMIKRVSLVELS